MDAIYKRYIAINTVMEINTLVYIGVALVLVSIGLFIMNNFKDVYAKLLAWKDRTAFTKDVKKDLKTIDANIQKEIAKPVAVPEKPESLKKPVAVPEKPESLKKPVAVPEKTDSKNKEVFLVANNIFQRGDSNKVCKAFFNADVATMEQLREGYNNGANWCNYGWTADSKAYYPLQQVQNNPRCFGEAGLNGGTMENTSNITLGVTCYGEKPSENLMTVDKLITDSSMAQDDLRILDAYRKRINNDGLKIAPFNNKKWSKFN